VGHYGFKVNLQRAKDNCINWIYKKIKKDTGQRVTKSPGLFKRISENGG